MTPKAKTAVLLMAHGAPEKLDDVAPYLAHIMRGRMPSQNIIDQIRERYRLVGGKSPLLQITRKLASALEDRLNQAGGNFRVYIGMRHWKPFIHESIAQILKDAPKRLLAVSLAPQYSRLSVGAYKRAFETALNHAGQNLPVQTVESWHKEPLLIEAFSEQLKAGLEAYAESRRSKVQILFTAHSLPAEILKDGDPYPEELAATVQGIVKRLGLGAEGGRWHFAYQSKGFRGGEWLGPQVEELIDDFAKRGLRDLLVSPIGFVSDHVEILYDIDILYKGLAASKGIHLKRCASLNTSDRFVAALAAVVRNKLSEGNLQR